MSRLRRLSFRGVRASRAFTLIELLAVITIIGILAALVIPLTGAIRKGADVTRSLSNLRQIGVAMNLHASENRNLYPEGYYYKAGEGERQWTSALVPYLMSGVNIYTAANSVFVSPLAEIEVRDGSANSGTIPSTYSVHGLLSPDTSGGARPLPRNLVARPTSVILVAESGQRSSTYASATLSNPSAFRTAGSEQNLSTPIPTDTDMDGVGGALRYRGKDKVPVVFVDGHVEAMPKGSVTYANVIADR